MQNEVKTISFKGQNIYVGIDVHLKSWTVTIIVGLVTHKSFSQDPSAELLAAYLCRKFPEGYHDRFVMQILNQRIGQFLFLIHHYEFIII